jgi:hypothetical protein
VLDASERELLERKRLLERAWRASPYYLPMPTPKSGARGGRRARARGVRGCACACACGGGNPSRRVALRCAARRGAASLPRARCV